MELDIYRDFEFYSELMTKNWWILIIKVTQCKSHIFFLNDGFIRECVCMCAQRGGGIEGEGKADCSLSGELIWGLIPRPLIMTEAKGRTD